MLAPVVEVGAGDLPEDWRVEAGRAPTGRPFLQLLDLLTEVVVLLQQPTQLGLDEVDAHRRVRLGEPPQPGQRGRHPARPAADRFPLRAG